MTIMIDTNIIISAALFPNGKAAQAFLKALTPPYEALVCDYIVDELHRKFREKFPEHLSELEEFLSNALQHIRIVSVPPEKSEPEQKIRDAKDRYILRAASHAQVDMLLTGDKDFLESDVTNPWIISVAEFLDKNEIG